MGRVIRTSYHGTHHSWHHMGAVERTCRHPLSMCTIPSVRIQELLPQLLATIILLDSPPPHSTQGWYSGLYTSGAVGAMTGRELTWRPAARHYTFRSLWMSPPSLIQTDALLGVIRWFGQQTFSIITSHHITSSLSLMAHTHTIHSSYYCTGHTTIVLYPVAGERLSDVCCPAALLWIDKLGKNATNATNATNANKRENRLICATVLDVLKRLCATKVAYFHLFQKHLRPNFGS